MKWAVLFHQKFDIEFDSLSEEVQDEALANIMFLASLSFHSLPRTFTTVRQKLMPGDTAGHAA